MSRTIHAASSRISSTRSRGHRRAAAGRAGAGATRRSRRPPMCSRRQGGAADAAGRSRGGIRTSGRAATPRARGCPGAGRARGPAAAPPADYDLADHPQPTARSVAAARPRSRSFAAARGAAPIACWCCCRAARRRCCARPRRGLSWKTSATRSARWRARGAASGRSTPSASTCRRSRAAASRWSRARPSRCCALRRHRRRPGDHRLGARSRPDPTTYADALAGRRAHRRGAAGGGAAALERGRARRASPTRPKPAIRALTQVDYRAGRTRPRRRRGARGDRARRLSGGPLVLDDDATRSRPTPRRPPPRAARERRARQRLAALRDPWSATASRVGVRRGAAGAAGARPHLALLVARGLAELPEDAAAGRVPGRWHRRSRRQHDVSGAIVDGDDLAARRARVDPAAALRALRQLPALGRVGDTCVGPGTSNLLDLHLLLIAREASRRPARLT